MTIEQLIQVYEEANAYLKQYDLISKGWKFELNKRKRHVGLCSYTDKTIYLSEHYVALSTPESITDTLLHEVAHALCSPGYGHGPVWRRKALEVGARPETCATADAISTATYNYKLQCPNCPDKTWYRHRLKRQLHGAYCPRCHTTLVIFKGNFRKD